MHAEPLHRAFLGSLVADALAMPVHWYYDTQALDRDYGGFIDYVAPKNPHPDSILWRSLYEPSHPDADILHDQARYWGQRGIHYHQFLLPGQNTVNYQLALELYLQITKQGRYDKAAWLEQYVSYMREPNWHGDTYVEEYHRAFFTRRAQGKALADCGIEDIHIGGLSQVPALIAGLAAIKTAPEDMLDTVATHIALTHRHPDVLAAGKVLTQLLLGLSEGHPFDDLLREYATDVVSLKQFEQWSKHPDREIVGQKLSTACYIEYSFPASLYLTWKHQSDFREGVLANCRVGGDNCHRGAVVGSLLGAMHTIPENWISGLRAQERLSEAAPECNGS